MVGLYVISCVLDWPYKFYMTYLALRCVAKVAYVQVIHLSFRWIITMSLCLNKSFVDQGSSKSTCVCIHLMFGPSGIQMAFEYQLVQIPTVNHFCFGATCNNLHFFLFVAPKMWSKKHLLHPQDHRLQTLVLTMTSFPPCPRLPQDLPLPRLGPEVDLEEIGIRSRCCRRKLSLRYVPLILISNLPLGSK